MVHIVEKRIASSKVPNRIYGKIYVPPLGQTPLGIVQICHGMAEHIGRYDDFMNYLAMSGYICCGHDQLGHGFTAKPFDLGFIDESYGDRYLLKDLYRFGCYVKKYAERLYGKKLPHILLGHSMGSFTARLAAEHYGSKLDALIISGTAGYNPAVKYGITLCKQVALFKGARYRSRALDKLIFGKYGEKTEQITDFDWLSYDSDVCKEYINDSLCGFLFTVSGLKDLLVMNQKCNRKEWFEKFPKTLPVLMISGDEDPVGDYGKGVKQVADRLKSNEVNDVTLLLYKHGRHEMLNELCKSEVYSDILFWLEKIIHTKNINK